MTRPSRPRSRLRPRARPRTARAGALVLALAWLGGCATAPPREPHDVCSIFEEKRGWHRVAKRAEAKWGASMHIPMAIMYQESAFRHKARPPRKRLWKLIPWRRPSSAYGYAQAVDGTWRHYIGQTGEYWRKRTDFADATDFIHWYLAEARRRNGVSVDDAFALYMNYHEGFGGYARGTHGAKPWLHKAATAVQQRSQRYGQQYLGCRERLERGFWARLFRR